MTRSKLIMAIGLTTVLGTGLYASCNANGSGMMNKKMMKENSSCNMSSKMMKKAQKKSAHGPMSMFKKLNLSAEQQNQISLIKKDMMKDKITPDVAFTKEGFDKTKFIEIMKQKRENMIESKAEMIDRVYKILTPKQKVQLKVLMELKKEKKIAMMDKRMNFDKNCNGRR